MTEYTLIQATDIRRIYVRSWQPGDGLTCSYAKAAPRDLPCGRPVAISVTEDARGCFRWSCKPCTCTPRRIRRVVCENHIPTLKPPSEVTAEAKRRAHERLATEHWEEWQRYLAEATEQAAAERLEFADPEVRRIVLGDDGGER